MPYIGKSPEFGVRERFYYTQTSAGATSISGFDDNGTSLRFTDGNYVDVYLNGVLLVDGVDYGTSTANTISSLSALADGDVIEIVAYDVFNIAKNNAEVTRTRYYKTASGSETAISGNDDSGVAIAFPAGAQLDVSLNGVSLVAGTDYNTSTANTISGLSSLSAGQVIEIVKYEKFVVSDTVSAAAGGSFGGNLSVSGVISSNVPCFSITGNNGAYVTTSPIPFAVTNVDTASGVDLSNNRYTIPVEGHWHIQLQLGIVRNNNGGNIYPQIYRTRSGAVVSSGYSYFAPLASSSDAALNNYGSLDVSWVVQCNVGDTLHCIVNTTNAHYYNGSAECRFQGVFLG